MSLPTILFGIVLSTLYGSVFHFLRGGNSRKLLIDLVLAWAGFWAGDSLGWYMGWTFWSVGVLNAGMGTVGSLAFLLIADLISHIQLPTSDQEGK
jgi:hypothetical protein